MCFLDCGLGILEIVADIISKYDGRLRDKGGFLAAVVIDGSGSGVWATFQHLGYSNPEF